MEFFNSIIGYPLGWIMWLCYLIVPSYAVALVMFTLVTKILLVPVAIKQQKSTVRLKMFQPKVQELQKKYANNKAKLNEELSALYQRENYNPMAGCLPMLIQMPILFGLIDVVYKPLTHILRISSSVVSQAAAIAEGMGINMIAHTKEIAIIGAIKDNPSAFSALGGDIVQKISDLNLTIAGVNLTQQPALALNLLILVPILSGVTSMLVAYVTQKTVGEGAGDNAAANSTAKTMMYMMPLISLWFTFQVPAGVGIYWIISNVLMMTQTLLLNKFYNPGKIAAQLEADATQRKEQERQEKIEAKKLIKETEGTDMAAALSQKEIDRLKLAAARKRDAEKYGEIYEEVTDADLK